MNMKRILIMILLIPYIVLAKEQVEFISCVDGDTIWVKKDNKEIKVRMISINAPEIEHEDIKEEPYGEESKEFVCNTLSKANKIELEYDSHSKKEDKYGRTLAWIWVDDKLLQELIVKKGLAKVDYVYDEYEYSLYLCKIENKAIKNKKGIWKQEKDIGYCKGKDVSSIELDKKDEREEEVLTDSFIYSAIAAVIITIIYSIIYRKRN